MAVSDTYPTVKALLVGDTGSALGAASAPVATRTGVEASSAPVAVTLVANTAKSLLIANPARVRAAIYNPLATPLFVRKSASAATVSAGGYDFVIPSMGQFISDPYEYAGAYNGICATAGDVNVSEAI